MTTYPHLKSRLRIGRPKNVLPVYAFMAWTHRFTFWLTYVFKCTYVCWLISLCIDFFLNYQLKAHFPNSITIYMLHYNPQHVSSSTLLIFRRTNCIITASGIVTLCKWQYSMPVESGLQSALNRHTVCLFTEDDVTRGCNNAICPPEDEQGTARNMLRVIM